MHENVMPWLLDTMLDFLIDDNMIFANTEEVIKEAVDLSRTKHLESITKEYDRRNNLVVEKNNKI
jgi:hypothetical protein